MRGPATRPPVVEVVGPWLPNKGDGLNLWAIADRLGGAATLATSTSLGLPALPERPRLHAIRWPPDGAALRQAGSAVDVARLCRDAAILTLAPRSMLRQRRVVVGREVALLLDCSGFAYGDAWSTRRMVTREAYYRRLARQGCRIVVLPQAFGPFDDPQVRAAAKRLLARCDAIYARDRVSLAHLASLDLGERIVGIAPDVTHLVNGIAPADADAWKNRVCIVPSARMVDRTADRIAERYRSFLAAVIGVVRDRGLEPRLLVHESYDMPLAEEVRAASGITAPVVNEDPLVSKGILGAACAVIGSRYHALVSALSQGTPAIGTSWSHKYGELFGDYDCPEWLFSPDCEATVLSGRLDRFFAGRDDRARRLRRRAAEQKSAVEDVWRRVESMLVGSRAGRQERIAS